MKYLRTLGDTPDIVGSRLKERGRGPSLHTPLTGMEAIERSKTSTRDSVCRTAGTSEWEVPVGTEEEIRERVLRDLGVTDEVILKGKKPTED